MMLSRLALSLAALLAVTQSHGTRAEAGTSPPPRLRATIVPDKLIWAPRETIGGQVVIENVGRSVATIEPLGSPAVFIRDAAGLEPHRTSAIGRGGCGIALPQGQRLVPGATQVRRFRFSTDPLDPVERWEIAPGRYTLRWSGRGLVDDLLVGPASVMAPDVPIEVRGAADDLPPRIVRWEAGNGCVVVIREDGTIVSYDLGTGPPAIDQGQSGRPFDLGGRREPGYLQRWRIRSHR